MPDYRPMELVICARPEYVRMEIVNSASRYLQGIVHTVVHFNDISRCNIQAHSYILKHEAPENIIFVTEDVFAYHPRGFAMLRDLNHAGKLPRSSAIYDALRGATTLRQYLAEHRDTLQEKVDQRGLENIAFIHKGPQAAEGLRNFFTKAAAYAATNVIALRPGMTPKGSTQSDCKK